MSLKSQVSMLMDDTLRLCASNKDTDPFAVTLREMKQRLNTPLRVAVVGMMKAGKSTFLNALINANILYTGDLETTYTVCWFKYSSTASLSIVFRDGTTIQAPFEHLARWSVRAYQKENPRINDVKYIQIHYPSDVLKHIEFIDTPGLNSIHKTDAANTLDFMGMQQSNDTLTEASIADAVIYAFSHSAGSFDRSILEAFCGDKGKTNTSPINSIGILTKVDGSGIWSLDGNKPPLEVGKQVTSTIMQNSDMKRLLFTVLPVCAKALEGTNFLNDEDWELLKIWSKTDLAALPDTLLFAERFANSDDEAYQAYGPAIKRKRIIELIGQYGILLITGYLAKGLNQEQIILNMQSDSGVQAIRSVLMSHFNNRASLLKAKYIIDYLMKTSRQMKRTYPGNTFLCNILTRMEEKIDDLISSEQAMKELKILQLYYSNQLQFYDDQETDDFLRITGERGRNLEAKLDFDQPVAVADLKAKAQDKIAFWNAKASSFMLPGVYIEAAQTIARSYDYIYMHLQALCDD